ncbi:MAG: ATPase, T2SS/T4P/T4SS family [Planctomycetota bacterium]|nr:ATPase, T2SS/T4P/T4SS family [Planctomycetota bacterium]
MPNKTIYIKDEDASIFTKAQKMGGESISAVITKALRQFVEHSEVSKATKEKGEATLKAVHELFAKASAKRTSVIHLEPSDSGYHNRFRIDGVLVPQAPLSKDLVLSILPTLLSEEDVERDLGQASLQLPDNGPELDIRFSCLQSILGPAYTFQILRKDIPIPELNDLDRHGQGQVTEKFHEIAHKAWGLNIITGPSGCGKTTTALALLQEALKKGQKKVVTIENPVGYLLPGALQIPLDTSNNIDYATVLKKVLHADPDIIFIGEIRDAETLHLANQCALTGHQVITVLHAPTALGALLRMLNLGVEAHLLRDSLRSITAQARVQKTCQDCQGKGCEACDSSGSRGQVGVYEILSPDTHLKDALSDTVTLKELTKAAKKDGFIDLIADIEDKVERNVVPQRELKRLKKIIAA